jgi:hypothetical protein
MMARMTQTQITGAPDPDRSDPGLDAAQTQTHGRAQTPTRDPGPTPTPTQVWVGGRGLTLAPTYTPTPTPTQTPDPGGATTINGGGGSGRHAAPTPDPDPTPDPTDEEEGDSPPASKRGRDWIAIAMWIAIILLNVLALLLASSGQVDGTWLWAGLSGDDLRKWLLPAITEIGYVGFLLLGADALRREQSPFVWWALGGGVAATSVFMNSVHGEDGHKFQQGLIFGVASAVSLAMTFAKFLIDYRAYRRKAGHTTGLRPRALTLSAIRFPRVAIRADLIIKRCERVKTRERAYELAELWIWIYQDIKVKDDRRTAKRTAWITIYEELGQKVPDLTNLTVRRITFREPPPAPLPAAPPPPTHAIATVGAEQPAPTQRAVAAPRPRQVTAQPAAPAQPETSGAPVVVLMTGRSGGANWMSIDAIGAALQFDDDGQPWRVPIDRLPQGLDETICECRTNPTKWCGKTVLHHVQRRGVQIVALMRAVPAWATGDREITVTDVEEICKISGKEQRIEIMSLVRHLRRMVAEQSGRATISGSVIDAEVIADDVS